MTHSSSNGDGSRNDGVAAGGHSVEDGGSGGQSGGVTLDWRAVVSETAVFVRRVGLVPVAAALAVIVAAVVVAFLAGVRHGAPGPLELPLATQGAPTPIATTQPSSVRVHLAGAVVAPGLYEAPSSFRVGDLLEVAGGPTADADTTFVNLAEPVRDGQQVFVPTVGDSASMPGAGGAAGLGGAASGAAGSGPVDVNAATAAQLEALPGIGPSLAAAIVAYRDAHGPFASVDALQDVPGIGQSKLESLRPNART